MTGLTLVLAIVAFAFFMLNVVQTVVICKNRKKAAGERGRPIRWADLPTGVRFTYLGEIGGASLLEETLRPQHRICVSDWEGEKPEAGDRVEKQLVHRYETKNVNASDFEEVVIRSFLG